MDELYPHHKINNFDVPFQSNVITSYSIHYTKLYDGLTNEGERIIDSQYLSSTVYQTTVNDDTLVFGVNFADGRIKGYALHMEDGSEKTFSIIYVRGSNTYGINDFIVITSYSIHYTKLYEFLQRYRL